MPTNRLHPSDDVRVEIFDPDGKEIDAYQGSGYRNVSEAVSAAYEGSDRTHLEIEDYVFRVTDLASDTSARYRVNAGGHVRLIPEE